MLKQSLDYKPNAESKTFRNGRHGSLQPENTCHNRERRIVTSAAISEECLQAVL
jgi:hypothetical protein